MSSIDELNFPFDPEVITRNCRKYVAQLESLEEARHPLKLAILGGSTTSNVKDQINLFLLDRGIKADFYESDFGRFYEESLFPSDSLREFAPDFVYLHVTSRNIELPAIGDSREAVNDRIEDEVAKYTEIWASLQSNLDCTVIQNNFELPRRKPLGNLDISTDSGVSGYTLDLNRRLVEESLENKNVVLNDIFYLSSRLGLDNWYDEKYWYRFKNALGFSCMPFLSYQVANLVSSILGKSKKCLVLDLDNTIWGGVIGDDGIDHIRLGPGTADGEVFSDIQHFVKSLQDRGVILAIASKNDHENAILGLNHAASQIGEDSVADIQANWQPKNENIETIATNINIGLEALVFADDNPAERNLVKLQLPDVTVPKLGPAPEAYANMISDAGYFEALSLSESDFDRTEQYASNIKRQRSKNKFSNYDDYLGSLDMEATFAPINESNLDRVAQLINKTNQFNLTTKRRTTQQVSSLIDSDEYVSICANLTDKYGDNGLVSIMIGAEIENTFEIDTWLMSCRVFKRGLEDAVFGRLIEIATEQKIDSIVGKYIVTKKNNITAALYRDYGFDLIDEAENGDTNWRLSASKFHFPKHRIEVVNKELT